MSSSRWGIIILTITSGHCERSAAIKIRMFAATIILFLILAPFATAQYSGGTGEPNDPYQIATAEDLITLGESTEDYDKHFILTADIDLDPNLPGRKVFDKAVIAPDMNDINEQWLFDGTPFTGVFDGNGHAISHLTIRSGSYLGLFGQLGSEGEICNLGLQRVDVNGTGYHVGGFAGSNGGSIINCNITGLVSGDATVGSLVAYNYGRVSNCYSNTSVNGRYSGVGGLVGENDGRITNSYSIGMVTGDRTVGGLVGTNDGRITTSYSTASVTGKLWFGGLVGSNHGDGRISNSYSTGSVIGNDTVGGLVGKNGGRITMSYSTSAVSGIDHVGGLVGIGDPNAVVISFWDTQTSDQTASAGGMGLTTSEMQDINTYLNAGWDYADEILNGTCDYWQISPGDYPQLHYTVMPEGLGTAELPYLIRDANDLGTVWFEPRAHYRLEASIDLSGINWHMAVVPRFGGTFNGNGHVISNLHVEGTGALGLFGQLGSGATISNLGLEAVDVNGTGNDAAVGGLVSFNNGGNIASCYSTGLITGVDYVGGLVGCNNGDSSITSCYSTGSVIGNDTVGGLVGRNAASITTSYSTGTVSGNIDVGGLVGFNVNYYLGNGSITNCYSTGSVIGNDTVGGLVGSNFASITICYSSGSVTGDTEVGGLVGFNVVDFTGNWPIAGSSTSSFWDTQTSGQTMSDGGTGKTTAEMQTESTFTGAGWDFVGEMDNGTEDIWSICEGTNYPRLVWQISPADFVCPDGITLDDFYFFIDYLEDVNCDSSNGYCDGTDLDLSGTVDIYDLAIFVDYWLAEAQ